MSAGDRPLPDPPRTRFGRRLPGQEEPGEGLTSERLLQAAAEGRLEQFLQQELPEGEHARNLAMMVLGFSGMAPPPGAPESAARPPAPDAAPAAPASDGERAVPPEVLAAARQEDLAALTALLKSEHEKRSGAGAAPGESGRPPESVETGRDAVTAPSVATPPGGRGGAVDTRVVEELVRIAAENDVTVDWLVGRALRRYVEEHRASGRL